MYKPKANKRNPYGKQINSKEWIYLFDLYENNFPYFVSEFKRIKNKNFLEDYQVKQYFRRKHRKYLYNNRNEEVLMSKTGKNGNSGKTGRPKSSLNKSDLIKELMDDLPEDLVREIFEEGFNKIKEDGKKDILDKIKKIIDASSLSLRKLSILTGYSKSHLSRIKNGWNRKPKIKSNKEILVIRKFVKHKGIIGREPISAYLEKENNIQISPRQVGRYLVKNNLHCIIRTKSRKTKEQKNINVAIEDLVQRDYDNKFHKETIIATDVTYIDSPKDVFNNHVYLSVAFNHKSKKIESYCLSRNNDTKLIIDTFKDLNIDNAIIHSDHGSVYTTHEFQNIIFMNKWKQSMSRVGNSLDNREVEYLFSILKTELIYNLNIKEITFNKLKVEIENWIHYYNSSRIQKKLNWLAPCNV